MQQYLKTRAIIGDIRNISDDCISRPRPRVQYMHLWRSIKKKIEEARSEEGDTDLLLKLKSVLDQYSKPTNSDAIEIAKKCLSCFDT